MLSSAAQRLSDSEGTDADKADDHGRDIMLVIAGGEGYVDFRRGIVVSLLHSLCVTGRVRRRCR